MRFAEYQKYLDFMRDRERHGSKHMCFKMKQNVVSRKAGMLLFVSDSLGNFDQHFKRVGQNCKFIEKII